MFFTILYFNIKYNALIAKKTTHYENYKKNSKYSTFALDKKPYSSYALYKWGKIEAFNFVLNVMIANFHLSTTNK